MHVFCGCLCMKHTDVHLSVSVFVSVLVTHSLYLAGTQVVEDGEVVSERSPGLSLSDVELGRALARCPLWLFLRQPPGCPGINGYFPATELSGL